MREKIGFRHRVLSVRYYINKELNRVISKMTDLIFINNKNIIHKILIIINLSFVFKI